MDHGGGGGGIAGMIGGLIYLAIMVGVLAGMWKVFTKAGKPGWAILVPIYNIIVMLEIIGAPMWWIVMFLIPIANIIFAFKMAFAMARVFGQSSGFGIGLALLGPVFYPILGFGSAQYNPQARLTSG
jgi:hypothetical protein